MSYPQKKIIPYQALVTSSSNTWWDIRPSRDGSTIGHPFFMVGSSSFVLVVQVLRDKDRPLPLFRFSLLPWHPSSDGRLPQFLLQFLQVESWRHCPHLFWVPISINTVPESFFRWAYYLPDSRWCSFHSPILWPSFSYCFVWPGWILRALSTWGYMGRSITGFLDRVVWQPPLRPLFRCSA